MVPETIPDRGWDNVLALPDVCSAAPDDHDHDDPLSVHPDRLLAKVPFVTSSLPNVAVELVALNEYCPPVASCVTVPPDATVME